MTAGGDRLDSDGETMVSSADYTVIKCHWSPALSSPGYKCATMDAEDVCLESTLPNSRCVRFKIKQTPVALREKCQLDRSVDKAGCAHVRIDKAWLFDKKHLFISSPCPPVTHSKIPISIQRR